MKDIRPRHPIRVVAQRTGLTPATLRAWERRYDVVRPQRSEGGQRLYSDRDVARLNRLRELTELGRSIGAVASLPDAEATALLDEDRQSRRVDRAPETPGGPRSREWAESAFQATVALDSEALDGTLRRAAMTLGVDAFLDTVVAPLLHRLGTGWVEGHVTPAQEHLGTAVVDRVLTWLSDSPSPGTGGPGIVVATLPGERHSLGARIVSAVAIIEGWSVTYLGVDLPVAEIASAAEEVGASAVALSIVSGASPEETVGNLIVLRELLDSSVSIFVGGAAAAVLGSDRIPRGVELLDGLEGLRRELRTRR